MGSGNKQTVGYRYFIGLHMIVCHGPVDAVKQIIIGERLAWSGNVNSNTTISINEPDLFGGEKKEGGIIADVDIELGGPTQGVNSYLSNLLGPLVPGFRGLLGLVVKRGYVCAMSPYPKPWAVRVIHYHGKELGGLLYDVNGSANGIGIIYAAITNRDWGMGYSPSAIDLPSFVAAATTIKNEGLGLSMILVDQASVESFVGQVLSHINGILYTDRQTGKFKIKLVRNDYVLADLPVFDPSNIVALDSFERPVYNELINEIVVKYRLKGTIKDSSVTVQNLAGVQSQGDVVSETINYPGIDTAENANRVAMRDLRIRSTPLARVRLRVSRAAWNLNLGSVFKLTWPDHGLDQLVMRVFKIGLGDGTTREVTVDCVEDVFGLPTSTYLGNQTSQWVNPIQPPASLANRRIMEQTYWDLVVGGTVQDESTIDPTECYVKQMVRTPAQFLLGVEMWVPTTPSGYLHDATGQTSPYAALTAAISPSATTIPTSKIVGAVGDAVVGNYLILDDEVLRLDSYNTTTGAFVVGRGCLDTVPRAHNLGSVILLAEQAQILGKKEYLTGEVVNTKLLARTSIGLYDIGLAPTDTITVVGRQDRPYPPGTFRLNGVAYPTGTIANGDVVVSWTHRNRLQQLARPILDTTAGSVGPEVGTTYVAEVYEDDGSTLIASQSVAGTSTTLNVPISYVGQVVIFKLKAVRDGLDSFQSHQWSVEIA